MDVKGIKVTFLGTGPAGRIPRKQCFTPACEDARNMGSKSRRTQSSIFIECGGRNVLFDVTEDIWEQWGLLRDINRIDAVFITHAHKDAMGGILRLKNILKRLGQECIFVFAESETIARIKKIFRDPDFINFQPIKPGIRIFVNSLIVEGIRVEHTTNKKEFPTLGYIIQNHEKRVVYISDVKKVPKGSLVKMKNADALILDSAMYKKQTPWHMNLKEALALVDKVKPKQALLTQIGVEWPPHKEAIRIVQNKNTKVSVAYDGLVLF
ncbi:MAG: MBL fold metallo-hydrolase [Candidatus Harrisonbacteria bacterium]|nr:MBL fold metallo-hydrolase [Candidatus Harrisonbacteria bacterium]